jgi:hypothetical protein
MEAFFGSETVEQAATARSTQFLDAAPARRMRMIPRLGGRFLVQPGPVMVTDLRRSAAALRPVATGGIRIARESRALSIRPGEHVVRVRIAA